MEIDLTVAVIGAVALVVGVVIGAAFQHAGQISTFRQAWIDKLRELLVKAVEKLDAYRASPWLAYNATTKQQWEGDVDSLLLLIRLHLNKAEPPHKALVADLLDLKAAAMGGNVGAYTSKKEQVVAKTQDILKTEWTRVKLGEFLWRIRSFWLYLKNLPLD